MTKILQVVCTMYPCIGGIEQVARDVVNALKSRSDIEQKIICFNDDADAGGHICRRKETINDTIDGVEVTRCGCITKISSQLISLTYPHQLGKLLNSFNPDIVIFHYPNPYLAAFLLPKLKKHMKLIVYWHSDIVRQKILGKIFNNQNKKLLNKATKIVATSPNYINGSRYLTEFKDKCKVIPNCVQMEKLKVTSILQQDANAIRNKYFGKIICFTVGRHVGYKGLSYLIEAGKIINKNIKIVIGGSGPLTNVLKKEAYECDNIEFLGRLSNSEMIAFYLACDIYCFPSITRNEAFGIALAEAMYFGKPAVTFTIPGSGVNYVNLDGVTGIECPNGDSKAYAEALKKLASNLELREKYGRAARQRVLDNFTEEIFEKNLMEVIGELDGG